MKLTRLMLVVLGLCVSAQIALADWTPAKRLSWTPSYSWGQTIAVDPSGNLHVLWYDYWDPTNTEIFYTRSTDGGTTWTKGQRFTWTSGGSFHPAMAVDISGHLHVVWEDSPGMRDIYYRKSTDAGVTWTPSRRITWNYDVSTYPDIAVDSSGHLHVVWYDTTPGNPEIYYKKSTDGGATWTANRRLTWTSAYSRYPAIAVASSGHLHLVWEDQSSGHSDMYYKKSTDGGTTWTASRRITWTSSDYMEPAITVDSSNNPHVVWNADSTGNEEIYYKKSTDGGAAWTAGKRLSLNSGESHFPTVAAGLAGDLHVVWYDNTPGNEEIFYKKSATGGAAWAASQRITWTSGNSNSPAIAVDSAGNPHVVWDDFVATDNCEIFYKKFIK